MGRLWLIEGLPGSGKSTFAEKVRDKRNGKFYSEVDSSHPVDMHDVYWVEDKPSNGSILDEIEGGWLVRYGEGEERVGTDVYELPFTRHARIMCERWRRYVKEFEQEERDVIFECTFLQNPLTIGMVSQDVPLADIEAYVQEVADILKPLDPMVVYLALDDVARIFPIVYDERPMEWQGGFVEYYTSGAYGVNHSRDGVAGTIEILVERQHRELELLERLPLHHVQIQNDERRSFDELMNILEGESVRSCKP